MAAPVLHLRKKQTSLFAAEANPTTLLRDVPPYYRTTLGAAYLGDSLDIMKRLPAKSVNIVVTSPPYALHFKKEYGNVAKADYVDWFRPFGEEIRRILTDDGSFVLNIGGSYNPGEPTRSLYHFKLLIMLVEAVGFHLAQECFWFNPAKMPAPAEWVTVRRIRIRDSVEYVWWLSKTPWPKAHNNTVLRPYSKDMQRLTERGLNRTVRPSGYSIKPTFANTDPGGSIPTNVLDFEIPPDMLTFGNNAANDVYTLRCKDLGIKVHPARFPGALPDFFIRLLSDEGDLVLDPFAGSNTTGAVSEKLRRRWLAFEKVEEYLEGSQFRFQT